MGIPVVDHDRLAYYARAYTESNMLSTVWISRKLPAEFNELTGELVSNTPLLVYRGQARVYSTGGVLRMGFGDEPAYFSTLNISVPLVVDPMVDDLVVIETHPGDPAMVGRVFRVTDVEAGGHMTPMRRMSVTGVQESQQWVFIPAIAGETAAATAAGGVGALVGDAP